MRISLKQKFVTYLKFLAYEENWLGNTFSSALPFHVKSTLVVGVIVSVVIALEATKIGNLFVIA